MTGKPPLDLRTASRTPELDTMRQGAFSYNRQPERTPRQEELAGRYAGLAGDETFMGVMGGQLLQDAAANEGMHQQLTQPVQLEAPGDPFTHSREQYGSGPGPWGAVDSNLKAAMYDPRGAYYDPVQSFHRSMTDVGDFALGVGATALPASRFGGRAASWAVNNLIKDQPLNMKQAMGDEALSPITENALTQLGGLK
jgi:hypothetical protein